MLDHEGNCGFLTCSAEFYRGHIPALAICVYARIHIHTCTHTNVHVHTHMCTHARIQGLWRADTGRLFNEQLELAFIGWTGHSLYHLILESPETLPWGGCQCPLSQMRKLGLREIASPICTHAALLWQSATKPRSGWLQSPIHIRAAEAVGSRLLRDLTLKHSRMASGPSVSLLVWGLWGQEAVLTPLEVLDWPHAPDTCHLLSFPLENLLWFITHVFSAGLQGPDICSSIILDASVRVLLDELP